MVFIPKPGKASYDNVIAFRPISLNSLVIKTLERVVLTEIEETHLTKIPMNTNQQTFQKGSTCDSALSDMVDGIESAILRGQYALGIFLDISGASDNLSPASAIPGIKAKNG